MDRGDCDVSVDWFIEDLSRRELHDGRDRGIRGGVDLDPRGEVCRDGIGPQAATQTGDMIYKIWQDLQDLAGLTRFGRIHDLSCKSCQIV